MKKKDDMFCAIVKVDGYLVRSSFYHGLDDLNKRFDPELQTGIVRIDNISTGQIHWERTDDQN